MNSSYVREHRPEDVGPRREQWRPYTCFFRSDVSKKSEDGKKKNMKSNVTVDILKTVSMSPFYGPGVPISSINSSAFLGGFLFVFASSSLVPFYRAVVFFAHLHLLF